MNKAEKDKTNNPPSLSVSGKSPLGFYTFLEFTRDKRINMNGMVAQYLFKPLQISIESGDNKYVYIQNIVDSAGINKGIDKKKTGE